MSDRQNTSFVTHAWNLWGMDFQENPSHGSRNTTEAVLFSPSKVSFILEQITTKLTSFLAHEWKVECVKLQENAFHGSRDTAQEVLCFSNWSHSNYWPTATKRTRYVAHAERVVAWNFRKILSMASDVQEKVLGSPRSVRFVWNIRANWQTWTRLYFQRRVLNYASSCMSTGRHQKGNHMR